MLRACLVGVLLGAMAAPAFAQAEEELEAPTAAEEAAPEAPGEEVAEPEPEVSEPEPEVSEPEPEVSEPEPEVSDGGADELGRAAAEPTVDDDIAEATEEGRETRRERRRARREGDGEEGEGPSLDEASAENRLAAANPTAGLPWSMPTVYTNTITARTLRPNGQLTYNPYWNMTLSVRPRWNFTPALSVGARLDMDFELTDSGLATAYANPTNGNHELYLQDLRFDLTYSQGLGAGFSLTPSFQIRLPTSAFSRGADRILGTQGSLMLMRPIQKLGVIIPGLVFSYLYWFQTSNVSDPMRRDDGSVPDEVDEVVVGDARTSARCAATGSQGAIPDGGDCEDGTSNGQHQLALTAFTTIVPGKGFNVSMFYAAIWLRGAPLGTACLDSEQVVTASGDSLCLGDGSDTKWRIFGQFGFSVGYDITPYLTATLSYSTLAIHPDSDGNGIENPIWNENTTLGLSFQLRPSALAVKLRADRAAAAEGNEEAAIVRPAAF